MPTEFNETPLHGCSWLERVPGRPIDKDSPFEQQYLSAMYWSVTIFMNRGGSQNEAQMRP